MREAGPPLDRFQVAFRLLHPLFDGMTLTYTEETGLLTSYNTGRRLPTEAFKKSPYYHMLTEGLTEMRARLDTNEPPPFAIFDELRQQGCGTISRLRSTSAPTRSPTTLTES